MMTDDLRTRIAATMLRIFDEDQTLTIDMGAWIVADAVIRELKLEVEDGECGYCHAQLPGCRYSTWKADDD